MSPLMMTWVKFLGSGSGRRYCNPAASAAMGDLDRSQLIRIDLRGILDRSQLGAPILVQRLQRPACAGYRHLQEGTQAFWHTYS